MTDPTWLSDNQILQKIGEKIKEWRLENNLSQAEVAKQTGLALITYQKFEYGKAGSLKNFLRILRILGRLDLIAPFVQERELSPIQYHEFEKTLKFPQRASKKHQR